MKFGIALTFALFCSASVAQEFGNAPAIPESAGQPLYFQTNDYSSVMCGIPRDAIRANLITRGLSLLGDVDRDWLAGQKNAKQCVTLEPGRKFLVSAALPFYIHPGEVEWVVAVKAPTNPNGKSLGYIPVDRLEFIPLPTL